MVKVGTGDTGVGSVSNENSSYDHLHITYNGQQNGK